MTPKSGVVGGLSFALGFSGFVAAILARLEIEFRERGLWLSRSRGLGSVLGYDSLTSVRLLDCWHRKLKQRTRWLEIRSTAAVMKIELVATELPDDFDAIVDELGKHATITG